MFGILKRSLSHSLQYISTTKVLSNHKEKLKFNAISSIKYYHVSSTVKNDRDVSLSESNYNSEAAESDLTTRKQEPDYFLKHLRRSRNKDISEIMENIRLYRRLMNIRHMDEMVVQLLKWSDKRPRRKIEVCADPEFISFCMNIKHSIQFMDFNGAVRIMNWLLILKLPSNFDYLLGDLKQQIVSGIENASIEEMIYLGQVLNRHMSKKELQTNIVFIKLLSQLNNHCINEENLSQCDRKMIGQILSMTSLNRNDCLGNVILALYQNEENVKYFEILRELSSLVECYKILDHDEKLMADIIIKDNIAKVVNFISELSDQAFLYLVRKLNYASAIGVNVLYNEKLLKAINNYVLEGDSKNTVLLFICLNYFNKVKYFNDEYWNNLIQTLKNNDSFCTNEMVLKNFCAMLETAINYTDDSQKCADLIEIIDKSLHKIMKDKKSMFFPESYNKLTEQVESSDDEDDNAFSNDERDTTSGSRQMNFAQVKMNQLMRIAAYFAMFNHKSEPTFLILEKFFLKYEKLLQSEESNRIHFEYLFRLNEINEQYLNTRLCIPLSILDKEKDITRPNSSETHELLNGVLHDDNLYRLNVVSNSIFIDALIVVDEKNEIVPMDNAIPDNDKTINIEQINISPEYKRIAIQVNPESNEFYRSRHSLLDTLNETLLKRQGFTVINMSLSNKGRFQILTQRLKEISIKL